MKSQHAFSFIEIMMALSIISILAMLALPSLRYFVIDANDKILQLKLLQLIQTARDEVQALHMPIALCSSDHDQCNKNKSHEFVVFMNEEEDGVIKNHEQIISVTYISEIKGSLYWRSFPYRRNYFLFRYHDYTLQDNGTFWYCHENNTSPVWAIMLNQTGRARIVYPNKKGDIKDSKGNILTCRQNLITNTHQFSQIH